jgi:hypothetical protein|tara:strand:- start:7856 stop:8341 length:486 start_codon:yes stop_codon:yes gene_type:complete
MIKIEDNFLPKEDFYKLQSSVMGNWFPWYYIPYVGTQKDDDNFYLAHMIFVDHEIRSPVGWDLVKPIIKKLNPKSIIRIKANLYGRTEKLVKHKYHSDHNFDCKTALYYVNTNNGFTKMKKYKKNIGSIANRIVHFNSHDPHCSTTCTDSKVRITININYF